MDQGSIASLDLLDMPHGRYSDEMKAVLCFNLPEDQAEFEAASRSIEICKALKTFEVWLDDMRKDDSIDRTTLKTIRAEFTGIIEDHNIDI